MALVIPAMAAVMTANLASVGNIGPSAAQLGTGVATGLSMYAASGMTVVTVDAGSLGAGAGVGQGIILPPPVLIATLAANFAGALIGGIMSLPTATAIGNGLSQALLTATLITVHAGTGVGTGVAKIIPNPGASVPAFIAGFKAAGMLGVASITMATAVAMGLDAALPSATGFVVIAGPPSPSPGGGAGTGKVL